MVLKAMAIHVPYYLKPIHLAISYTSPSICDTTLYIFNIGKLLFILRPPLIYNLFLGWMGNLITQGSL